MKYILIILLIIAGLSVKGQCDSSLYLVDRDSSLLQAAAQCMRVAKYGNDPLTTYWTYLDKKQVADGDGNKLYIYRLDMFPTDTKYELWDLQCLGNLQAIIEKLSVCDINWKPTLLK